MKARKHGNTMTVQSPPLLASTHLARRILRVLICSFLLLSLAATGAVADDFDSSASGDEDLLTLDEEEEAYLEALDIYLAVISAGGPTPTHVFTCDCVCGHAAWAQVFEVPAGTDCSTYDGLACTDGNGDSKKLRSCISGTGPKPVSSTGLQAETKR